MDEGHTVDSVYLCLARHRLHIRWLRCHSTLKHESFNTKRFEETADKLEYFIEVLKVGHINLVYYVLNYSYEAFMLNLGLYFILLSEGSYKILKLILFIYLALYISSLIMAPFWIFWINGYFSNPLMLNMNATGRYTWINDINIIIQCQTTMSGGEIEHCINFRNLTLQLQWWRKWFSKMILWHVLLKCRKLSVHEN